MIKDEKFMSPSDIRDEFIRDQKFKFDLYVQERIIEFSKSIRKDIKRIFSTDKY